VGQDVTGKPRCAVAVGDHCALISAPLLRRRKPIAKIFE